MAIAVNNLPANAGDLRDSGSHHESRRSLGGEQPNPVFLPGKFHGQRSLAGYSPWGCKESDTTELLSTCTRAVSEIVHNLYSVVANPLLLLSC